MAILQSISDLRSWAGDAWKNASDEDLVAMYAKQAKLPVSEVADKLRFAPGEGGVAAKRTTASVSNYVGGLQGVGEAVSGALGFKGAEEYLAGKRRANEVQAQIASERAKNMGAVESYKEVDTVGKGLNYLGGLAIQSAPYAVEAITGGLEARALMGGTRAALSEARAALVAAEATKNTTEVARATQAVKQAERSLNIGSEIGVAAQSYPSAVGDILQNQREQTGGKTDLGAAFGLGVPYAALNVLGVESALGRGSLFRNTINILDRPGGITGGLARAGATAVGTGVKEGLSETGQEMLNQAGRMAVDDKAQFFDQEARDRYMESFVGGAALGGAMGGALGGYRRSEGYQPETNTQQPGNDVQQAFTQPQTSGTPITGQTPPAAPGTTVTAPPTTPNAPAGGAAVVPGQTAATDQTGAPAAPARTQAETDAINAIDQTGAPITQSAPAVVGGTTAVAQGAQAQTQVQFAAQQQQQIQDQREVIIDQFGLRGANPSVGQFFNRPILSVAAINQVADALGPIAAKLDKEDAAVMNAILQADASLDKGVTDPLKKNKIVKFDFDPNNIAKSVQKGVEAVLSIANKFQIGHVGSVAEAAENLNTLSQSAKGTNLVHINAIHQALTGQDTEGYIASQAPKPTKGKSNARQQQQQLPEQVPTGLGTVPEQGGTIQGDGGLTGLLQPGAVQPIGTGSDVGTAISQQAGQPSGEGVRPSASIAADNGSPVLTPQVTGVPSETTQTGTAAPASTDVTGQPGVSTVDSGTNGVQASTEQYNPRLQYYATDLNHISSERRDAIRDALLKRAISGVKTTEEGDTGENLITFEERLRAVEAILLEGKTRAEVEKAVNAERARLGRPALAVGSLSRSLLRLGISEKPALSPAQKEAKASLETDLGISPEVAAEIDALPETAKKKLNKVKERQLVSADEETKKAKEKENLAQIQEKTKAERKGLEVGDTVVNPKLGTGVVKSFAGNDAETRVTIDFQNGTTKELLVSVAKLEKTKSAPKAARNKETTFDDTSEELEVETTIYPRREARIKAANPALPADVIAKGVDRLEKLEAAVGTELSALPFSTRLLDVALSATEFPEFPSGITAQDFGYLYKRTERKVLTRKTIEDEQGSNDQDFDKTIPLAEELYGGESGEGKSMGFINSAGGSQGAVDSSKSKALTKAEDLQAMLAATPDTDVEGKASIAKQLVVAWKLYEREQKTRGATGEVTTTYKEEKATELGETEGEEDAVQVESADEGDVQEPAGGGEKVGKANAEPKKPARARKAKAESKPAEEAKPEIKTAEEQWTALAEQFPQMPPYATLNKDEKIRWDDVAERGVANLAAANTILSTVVKAAPTEKVETPAAAGTTEAVEPITQAAIDAHVEQTVDEVVAENPEATQINPEQQAILEEPVAALPEAQVQRLENHYGVKRGTSDFFTKLQNDVTTYAAKGAQAVAGAIRDIIKAVHAGVLAVAMVFNPSVMTQNSEVIVVTPKVVSETTQVKATIPAAAKVNMSAAAQEAYQTLYPAIKDRLVAENKFMVITDKPNARLFIFNPDGSLFLQKKVLVGRSVGDFYKGNTDKVENRITPAGLFTMGLRDATRSENEKRTAGEYDFGKVFVLDKAIDGEYSVTLFHSVWTHETDAQQRLSALKKEGAADSRYSFGCINVDKATFGSLVANNLKQMDGAALFIVPDKQELIGEFLTGDVAKNKSGKDELTRTQFTPKTVTTTRTDVQKNAQAVASGRNIVGKEEKLQFGVTRAVKNPYTAAELMADIKNFIRADILGNKLIIVDSVSDLIRHPDADLRAVGKAVGDKGAYGVAANGKAYLIANRIEQGQGRAKFMHEVGAHLGLENLLPKVVYDKLASQIDTWAKVDNGSVESQLAKAAQARVEAAQTSAEDRQSEMLAYFIEEAVQSGIDPTAADKESAALQSWFRTLWAAFKVAIRRLGFKTETLTAQDIVNLAFGAARLEITGTWHGTAADFRKFSHAFMSSGEGAQAFGWGTYLAQRVGVAKGYWTEDVNRKTQGVKGLQIEPTNGVPLNRKEKMVLTQIEHGGVHHNGWKDELRNRYVPYWTKELAKAKDAYDWVKSGLPRGGRNNAEHYQGIISQLSELLSGTESLLAPGRAELRIEPKKVEGSLMRVDTSVSDNEMIDWDAPIADQPKIVKEFFGDFLSAEVIGQSISAQIKTGGDIYKYLLAKFYKDAGNTGKWDYAEKQTKLEIKKAVSQYLDAYGIKGHKFFDQLSRSNGAVDVLTKRITNDEKFLATLKDRNVDHWSEVTQAPMTEKARVATIEMVEENIASLKNDLAKEQANRTQNTVIYNDKNIFRVGTEIAADKQRMKFGFAGVKGLTQRGMTDKQVSNLTTAKLMDANGELRSDIWYDTGWLRGVDNQWRTEFSDKDAKMVFDRVAPDGKVKMNTQYRLGDILSHLPLYRLYPEIADYPILFDPNLPPGHAAFDPDNKLIVMSGQQPDDVGVLLHEVQHAIQEIEGFGRGGSVENMDVYNVNIAEKFYMASPLFTTTDAQQVAIFKYYSAVEALHNLKALQAKMNLTSRGYTLEERSRINDAFANAERNAELAFDNMLSICKVTKRTVQENMYILISGEVEARDVEARREYNNELRRQVVPGEGEGINRDMQLVFDKSTGKYMSIGKTADEHAREQISKLPPKWQPAARTVTTTLMHTLKKAGLASMITEDVINSATKYMKSAQNYLTAQYARQATRLAHELKIEKILQQHDKLPENLKGTGKGSVNEYIHDSTLEGLWGYYPDARMVGTTMAQIDPGFKARFDAFPPAAQKLIKDVFEQGHDSLVAKQKAVTDAINREYADRAAAVLGDADLTAELNKEKNLRIARESKLLGLDGSKPYAYMGRYGDYVVVAKSAEYKHHEEQAKAGPMVKGEYVYGSESQKWLEDNRSNPAHYVVQFAETLGEADQIAEQLNATGNYDIAESFEKEPYSQEGGEMFAAVARLRNLYDRESDGDNPAAAKAIRNLLGDLYLHTVSEASARKSEFQRLKISGSDKDMMRNLATRGRADAHFLAALQHNDAISDSITDMREERNRNRREATPYFNELLKRHANSMKYETPNVLATALMRMSTVWFLSTSPSFYLQQILQTGTLSLPYMAGRLGYFRSARAIKLAYSDMATLVKGLGVSDHVDFDKAPADVRAMLNTLVGMGKIDIGIDSDSSARAGDTGVVATVMQKLQGVNNRIETINRATAAIAAYRGYLDRYKNNDTAAATKYAAEVVSNTHGSYDAFNTPRIMSGPAGKVLLQFKRFQIIQLSMLTKLLTTAFKGASAEEKTVARHSLAFIAGQMGVLGGIMAVPFAQKAASILAAIFGEPDEPDDWEFKLRRMIGDKAVADLLISGVPGAMGVDLSGKIGLGNVTSILPFTNVDLTSRSGFEKVIVGLMGPTVGLGLKFADGLGMMTQGDYYKGLEQMLPNGIANVLKSGRFATEGITMRNGDVVLKPEEISMLDAAFQAVGLPTNTITDRQFTQKVVKEFDQYYKQRDTEIKGDYVEGSRKGDSAAMGDAIDEWNKLQASRVANGYKRQPFSDLYKAPMAAIKRERNVSGGVEFTKSNRQLIESLSTI